MSSIDSLLVLLFLFLSLSISLFLLVSFSPPFFPIHSKFLFYLEHSLDLSLSPSLSRLIKSLFLSLSRCQNARSYLKNFISGNCKKLQFIESCSTTTTTATMTTTATTVKATIRSHSWRHLQSFFLILIGFFDENVVKIIFNMNLQFL